MKLDVTSLEKALNQLMESLDYWRLKAGDDEGLRRQFRAATIQAFEFTYEIAVKMIRRQLGQIVANPAELKAMDYMTLMRTAAEANLMSAVPLFRDYREKRNMTNHSYAEEFAEDVLSMFDPFVEDIDFLLKELKRRNQ